MDIYDLKAKNAIYFIRGVPEIIPHTESHQYPHRLL